MTPEFNLRARIEKVITADCYDLLFYLPFNIQVVKNCRIYSPNKFLHAWEIKGANREAGLYAKKFSIDKFEGQLANVDVYGTCAFGKVLCDIILLDGSSINESLEKMGHLRDI